MKRKQKVDQCTFYNSYKIHYFWIVQLLDYDFHYYYYQDRFDIGEQYVSKHAFRLALLFSKR